MKKSELAFTSDKNQVGTPRHIVQFISDLFEASGKKVLDPTAGSGNLLEFAGQRIGIELDEKAYKMLCERYPDGTFICADVMSSADWMRDQAPDLIFMNPPFNVGKSKGLDFVAFVADTVNNGTLAAIVPPGALNATSKAMMALRADILTKHTLKAVMGLNSELFYPAAATSASIIVLELGKPHSGPVWFADFGYDGLEPDRAAKCRIDKTGIWPEIEARWLDHYHTRPTHDRGTPDAPVDDIPCNLAELEPGGRWDAGTHINMDPSATAVTTEDFYKTVKDYMTWAFATEGAESFLKRNPDLLPPKQAQIRRIEHEISALTARIADLQTQLSGLRSGEIESMNITDYYNSLCMRYPGDGRNREKTV